MLLGESSLTLSVPKANLKGVTTQMKALNGGVHIVAVTDFLHTFAIFMFILNRETWQFRVFKLKCSN